MGFPDAVCDAHSIRFCQTEGSSNLSRDESSIIAAVVRANSDKYRKCLCCTVMCRTIYSVEIFSLILLALQQLCYLFLEQDAAEDEDEVPDPESEDSDSSEASDEEAEDAEPYMVTTKHFQSYIAHIVRRYNKLMQVRCHGLHTIGASYKLSAV